MGDRARLLPNAGVHPARWVWAVACVLALALPGLAAARGSAAALTPIYSSVSPTIDPSTGLFHSPRMSIEVVLAPSHGAGLRRLLAALYDPHSRMFRHWLARGQFDARFAPAAGEREALVRWLRAQGLRTQATISPFLVRATGSSLRISAALHTTIRTYRDVRGISYFANSTPPKLPASLARGVLGVVGLTNTVRARSGALPVRSSQTPTRSNVFRGMGAPNPNASSCETPYVTTQQLFNAVNNGIGFPYGYGAGPGCSGLTPSQTNGIYEAPHAGPRGAGAGATLAVFELSAYQASDVETWAHTFYGPGYRPPLENITVDGGPLSPQCPTGDQCPAQYNEYSGDIEVDADIEQMLSIAPDVSHLLVYNAPNDFTGQTELDEYSLIANQDQAESISSSWGQCERDSGAAYAQAENVIFEQMAAQGQSMFASAGDTGAFDCIRDGTSPPDVQNVDDPASQPYVTSVGGTSLESYNPGLSPTAHYPAPGTETVWNVDGLCNESADEGGQSGYFWCGATGAGGGGYSQFWGMPHFQAGPGVINPLTATANDTTNCTLAAAGTPCREVPDVSADADEYTPYAEYCTANASTPYSACTFSSSQTVPGWFGIGGTSLSSPLWAAIIGDRDAYFGLRTGNADVFLYALFDSSERSRYFHDITGVGQQVDNNGLFPVTPGYDMATGIGTPIMRALITGARGPGGPGGPGGGPGGPGGGPGGPGGPGAPGRGRAASDR